ncbi:hypothetical protein B0H13DRAFT_2342304 [Mycena leptocephala]|nr:hypothetical protein B0H13DRAFT_2342304 [Mycena leptocephala]
MARIDLGVEPAHMPDSFSIFMNDSMDTANMKGVLQYLPPGAGKVERMGFEANSVGHMEFGNGTSQQLITCTAHIPGPRVSTVGEDIRN